MVSKTTRASTGKASTGKASTGKASTGKASTVVEGQRAPSFALHDADGVVVTAANLTGKPYVLYFYPRDNTPGCTREAQGFRDLALEFAAIGVRIIGVSPDSSVSHQKFRAQHGLTFTLLSDPDRSAAAGFGAYGPKKMMGRETIGVIRSTFLIDAEGVVRRAWRAVRVDGHVADVLAAAREAR